MAVPVPTAALWLEEALAPVVTPLLAVPAKFEPAAVPKVPVEFPEFWFDTLPAVVWVPPTEPLTLPVVPPVPGSLPVILTAGNALTLPLAVDRLNELLAEFPLLELITEAAVVAALLAVELPATLVAPVAVPALLVFVPAVPVALPDAALRVPPVPTFEPVLTVPALAVEPTLVVPALVVALFAFAPILVPAELPKVPVVVVALLALPVVADAEGNDDTVPVVAVELSV